MGFVQKTSVCVFMGVVGEVICKCTRKKTAADGERRLDLARALPRWGRKKTSEGAREFQCGDFFLQLRRFQSTLSG